ncbi:MAG TPA: CDP-alcohol phosphatidyltransferase family protein [Polyangiaceae bacterium]|nr:CDP-alcohol phosphatidyltransferase family protein [Polyangiaceae bacterium]
MLGTAARVYRETRKNHDQIFNTYFMRPVAAVLVAAVARTPVTPNQLTLVNFVIFVAAAAMFVAMPSWSGGLWAVAVLELSYCFDCADGMLARFKKLASKTGHLFDFFTDEAKAVLLAAALGLRAYRAGGLGYDGTMWSAGDPRFLFGAIAAVVVVASAISLTNFLRRPELSGRETTVEAFYEAQHKPGAARVSPVRRVAGLVMTFLQWLNHYPSHIWVWALFGRLDAYLWLYLALNAVYLGRGWLGIFVRFGRTGRPG